MKRLQCLSQQLGCRGHHRGTIVTETSSFVVTWTDSTDGTADNGLCEVVVEYELP